MAGKSEYSTCRRCGKRFGLAFPLPHGHQELCWSCLAEDWQADKAAVTVQIDLGDSCQKGTLVLPDGTLRELTADDIEALREAWQARYKGPDQSAETLEAKERRHK